MIGTADAKTNRDFCLAAIPAALTIKDQRALWRVAAEYNREMRSGARQTQGEVAAPVARHREWGSFVVTRELG